MKRDVRRFVDSLLRQRRPDSFRPDDEDAAVMRTAIELSAARPGADEPSSEFVSELRDRIQHASGEPRPAGPVRASGRRRVLQVAAGVASAFTVGVVVDRAAGSGDVTPPQAGADPTLVPTVGTWATVAQSSELAEGAVREF